MRKVIITLAVASFVITGFYGTSFAQTQPVQNQSQINNTNIPHQKRTFMHHKRPNKAPGQMLSQKLNLTEKQNKEAEKFRTQAREKMKPLIDEMRTERQKMRSLIQSKASQTEIQNQKAKLNVIRTKIRSIHEENLKNFESILTPEQKAQFQEFKKQQIERMQAKKAEFQKYRQQKMKQMKNQRLSPTNSAK